MNSRPTCSEILERVKTMEPIPVGKNLHKSYPVGENERLTRGGKVKCGYTG